MCNSFAFGALLAIALGVGGCTGGYFDPIVVEPPEVALAQIPPPPLQSGDRIKVTVYGEESLNGIYDIDPNGFVSLPLAGTIRAAGLTKIDLQRIITRKYKSDYLQDPKVTVDVASFRPFFVLGEAERPGEYPYKNGMNLLNAIATAGGRTYRASRSSVLVQRAGEGVWKEYPISAAIQIFPGDVIRIPERYF